MVRKLNNEELANLLNSWNNSTVDTSKYYQSVCKAWEIDKKRYDRALKEGFLCQVCKERYYVGL